MKLLESLKERTILRASLAAVLAFFVGCVLLVCSEATDFVSSRVWLKAVVANLGGLLIASVSIAFLWEIFSKKALLDELLAKTQLADEVREAGLSGISLSPLRGPDFPTFLKEANKVDIFVVYANTWRANFEQELRLLARKPGARVRVFFPDPANTSLMTELAIRLGSPNAAAMKQKIEVAIAEFRGIFNTKENPGLDFSVWVHKQAPLYSFYRFNNVAVVTLYKHSYGRGDAPTMIAQRGGSMYSFLEADVDAMIKGAPNINPLARRLTDDLQGGVISINSNPAA
jgi:hypothetical protein